MSSFTLDQIRTAAEAKYGATEINDVNGVNVRLLNPLRIQKDYRNELIGLQEQMEADGADQEALLSRAVRLIAETGAQADALLNEVGDDLAVLAEIFETYSAGTQLGEASASRD